MSSNELIKNEFFIIDSDNLDEVNEKLYGFSIENNNVVKNEDVVDYGNLDTIGAFVLIRKTDDGIVITQDIAGSYGIYIYENDGYFAISNSFINLVEYLKFNHKLSFNSAYANCLVLPRALVSPIYKQTLVNEIKCIDRNMNILININTKEITFEEIDFEENSIPINTELGLKTLDNWFFKWVEIIRSVYEKSNNISIDLTGGFDSRMVLTLILASNIDLSKIRINSLDNLQHNHDEDYRIASLIAEEYGFELNNELDVNYINYEDIGTVVDLSSYVKLGFANQLNFKLSYPQDPIFKITGNGGGASIRGWPKGTSEFYVRDHLNRARRLNRAIVKSCESILMESVNDVKSKIDIDDKYFQAVNYKETRLRNHFGKLTVENYLSNIIMLSPLLDLDLFKLKILTNEYEKDLLMTLIFVRYCPKLLEFEVEGGREFNEDIISLAEKINEIHPFKSKEYSFLTKEIIEKREIDFNNPKKISWYEVNDYLIRIFKSKQFKYEFKKYSPRRIYDSILNSVENNDYFPIQDIVPTLAILKVIHAIKFNKNADYSTFSEWLNSFLDDDIVDDVQDKFNPQFKLLLTNFITARLDIKNSNLESNTVEILEISDSSAKVEFPKWMDNEDGTGCVVESYGGYLNLKIKCIGEGKLSINLRSINSSDKDKNHYPIFIDFTDFRINDERILNENKIVWHDNPFRYGRDVKDGEMLDIYLEWMPINKGSSYGYSDIFSEIENLKKENENLKRVNDEMLSSKSWKITKPLRKLTK